MTREDLAQLSRDELIAMILTQYHQNVALQEAVAELKADNEALRLKLEKSKKPPTNSSNSSQPPSKDQKRNLPKDRRRRRHGAPVGHAKHERKMVAKADHVVSVKAETCQSCQMDLRDAAGVLRDVNQITELPPVCAEVIEVRQYEITCPGCGTAQVGQPAAGLEMERTFGARLEATVVYYRQEQHMSYQRTQRALLDLYAAEISQGGIDQIMQRSGQKAIGQAQEIEAQVAHSRVIHCDETGSRINGSTWWEWVFCSLNGVLHKIRDNRSVDTIQDVMGAQVAEVWVSDCLTSQLKAPARQRQLCMAHQLRNLQAVVDAYPSLLWPKALQTVFRFAIHLHHDRQRLPPEQFCNQVKRIERVCDRLLERSQAPPHAARLQRRYRKYRQHLFVFLYRSDVEPTNNVAERALRASVVHRKVTGGFRSEWGAKAYAALASVIDTAELQGIHAFEAIQSLFGPPSLPLPVGR
jgi:transposase